MCFRCFSCRGRALSVITAALATSTIASLPFATSFAVGTSATAVATASNKDHIAAGTVSAAHPRTTGGGSRLFQDRKQRTHACSANGRPNEESQGQERGRSHLSGVVVVAVAAFLRPKCGSRLLHCGRKARANNNSNSSNYINHQKRAKGRRKLRARAICPQKGQSWI